MSVLPGRQQFTKIIRHLGSPAPKGIMGKRSFLLSAKEKKRQNPWKGRPRGVLKRGGKKQQAHGSKPVGLRVLKNRGSGSQREAATQRECRPATTSMGCCGR